MTGRTSDWVRARGFDDGAYARRGRD